MRYSIISGWFEKLLKTYGIAMLLLMAMSVCYVFVYDRAIEAVWQAVLLLLALILTGGLALVSVRFYYKSKYFFYAFVILLSVLSCALWNLFADTQPVSDYKVLIDAGYQIANGTFNEAFSKDSYFYYYNYQTGYAAYIGFVFRLFGPSLTALKILDISYISLSTLLIFAIASRISGKNEACIAAGLYAGFIPIVMGSSVINNQHLSTFLMLLGIYMVIKLKPAYIGLGALFIAAMNIFRPVGVIMLIAIPVYFLYRAFYERRIMPSIKYTAVFLAVFFAVTWGVDAAVVNARIAPSAISSSNLPYFKLVSGLCDQFGSIYGNMTEDARQTSIYFDLKQNNFDYDSYNKKSFEFLQDKLRNTGKTCEYVFKKMRFFLGERDHQYTFALTADKSAMPFVNSLAVLGQMQYLVLVLLAAWSVLLQLRGNDNRWIFILIILVGFISVYVLIEAQTRYRYEAYLMIIMLASQALACRSTCSR